MSDSTGALDPRGYAIVDQAWFDWMREISRTVPTLLCPNHPDNSYSQQLSRVLVDLVPRYGGRLALAWADITTDAGQALVDFYGVEEFPAVIPFVAGDATSSDQWCVGAYPSEVVQRWMSELVLRAEAEGVSGGGLDNEQQGPSHGFELGMGDGHPGPEVGTEEYLDSALQLRATMDGQRNRIVSRGLTPDDQAPLLRDALMGLGLAYDKADNRALIIASLFCEPQNNAGGTHINELATIARSLDADFHPDSDPVTVDGLQALLRKGLTNASWLENYDSFGDLYVEDYVKSVHLALNLALVCLGNRSDPTSDPSPSRFKRGSTYARQHGTPWCAARCLLTTCLWTNLHW